MVVAFTNSRLNDPLLDDVASRVDWACRQSAELIAESLILIHQTKKLIDQSKKWSLRGDRETARRTQTPSPSSSQP
jgi:hypothetical protein